MNTIKLAIFTSLLSLFFVLGSSNEAKAQFNSTELLEKVDKGVSNTIDKGGEKTKKGADKISISEKVDKGVSDTIDKGTNKAKEKSKEYTGKGHAYGRNKLKKKGKKKAKKK